MWSQQKLSRLVLHRRKGIESAVGGGDLEDALVAFWHHPEVICGDNQEERASWFGVLRHLRTCPRNGGPGGACRLKITEALQRGRVSPCSLLTARHSTALSASSASRRQGPVRSVKC